MTGPQSEGRCPWTLAEAVSAVFVVTNRWGASPTSSLAVQYSRSPSTRSEWEGEGVQRVLSRYETLGAWGERLVRAGCCESLNVDVRVLESLGQWQQGGPCLVVVEEYNPWVEVQPEIASMDTQPFSYWTAGVCEILTPSSDTLLLSPPLLASPNTSLNDSLVCSPGFGLGGLMRSISEIVWLGGDGPRACCTIIFAFGFTIGPSNGYCICGGGGTGA